MIVDLITNNKAIFDYVKEGMNEDGVIRYGRVKTEESPLKLVNFCIGFVDWFCEDLDNFTENQGIDMNKFGYRVLNPRGEVAGERGNLS